MRSINAFLDGKEEQLDFENFTFDLRVQMFSELDVVNTGLLKRAQKRANQSFDRPGLLLIKIPLSFVDIVQNSQELFTVIQSSISHIKQRDIRFIEMDKELPDFSHLYSNELASRINALIHDDEESSEESIIDDNMVVVPVKSNDHNMMFEFDDF